MLTGKPAFDAFLAIMTEHVYHQRFAKVSAQQKVN